MTDNPENLIIKSPPIRLIYNYDNQRFNQISFPLYPSYDKLKRFIKLINRLENYIQEMINKPDLTFVSNIKKNNNIKNIKQQIEDIAKKFGTPSYCYSYLELKKNINNFKKNY